MLALPAIPSNYNGAFVGTYSAIVLKRKVEPAGLAFYTLQERNTKNNSQQVKEEPKEVTSTEDTEENVGGERKKKNLKDNSSISIRVRSALEKKMNLYHLVCSDPSASCDDIKKTFRKLALILHPDKNSAQISDTSAFPELPDLTKMNPEELHQHYLTVYEAFEILTDPTFRRQYDSHLPFDNSLPTERELSDKSKYFDLCSAAFAKEARWCVKQPVPDFGDINTPVEQVKEFYKYWAKYESWRDFSNAGEFNLEDAQDREEKRWMQRENWKVVKQLVKNERQRVLKFVNAAESMDPRLIAARQQTQQAKLEASKAKMSHSQLNRIENRSSANKYTTNAKTKAIEEAKAAIVERRRAITEARKRVRSAMNLWIVAHLGADESLVQCLDKFLNGDEVDRILALDKSVKEIQDRHQSNSNKEGAGELKILLKKFLM